MATLGDSLKQEALRLFLYGMPKMKKSWWALKAAEAGYNVLYIDNESSVHIARQIQKEAQAKITVVNAQDTLDRQVAALFMIMLLRGNPFAWMEQRKDLAIPGLKAPEGETVMEFDITKLTINDVLIIDSWTKLVRSLMLRWFKENNIDASDGEQAKKSDWSVYRWAGVMADWVSTRLIALPCHVIVIGHETTFEKMKTETSPSGKQIQTPLWSRTQPVSVSNNHGGKFLSDFTDIFYFKTIGNSFYIDTEQGKDRLGGARVIPPKQYKWDELTFAKVCEIADFPVYGLNDLPPSEAWKNCGDFQEWSDSRKKKPAISAVPKSEPMISSDAPAKSSFKGLLDKQRSG